MGRLPDTFAGRKITFRVPYAMPSNFNVTSAQTGISFPNGDFSHAIDKPFEIHRMIPRVVALDESNIPVDPQPDQQELLSLVSFRILDFGKNESLTKKSALGSALVKGTSELTWEWADPYYLVRSEGFQVDMDISAFPTNFATLGIVSLAVYLDFQGFLTVIAPPNGNR